MAHVLRKISFNKWLVYPDIPWLSQGDLQADALVDLRTSDNKLSVFLLEDVDLGLRRVASAMTSAAFRQHPEKTRVEKFDYVVVEEQVLVNLGFKFEEEAGDTPDREVNRWHRNLSGLSLETMQSLAKAFRSKGVVDRLYQSELVDLLQDGYEQGYLDLKDELVDRLRLKKKHQD